MTQDDIFDFKSVAKMHNTSKITITKVRQISIESNTATYKQDFHGPEKTVSLLQDRVGRPVNWKTFQLPRAYHKSITLKEKQLKDLIELCDKGHLVGADAQFYYDLAENQDEDYVPPAGAPPDDSDSDESLDSDLEYDSDDGHDSPHEVRYEDCACYARYYEFSLDDDKYCFDFRIMIRKGVTMPMAMTVTTKKGVKMTNRIVRPVQM